VHVKQAMKGWSKNFKDRVQVELKVEDRIGEVLMAGLMESVSNMISLALQVGGPTTRYPVEQRNDLETKESSYMDKIR
jgi:hypothetical protein